MFESLKKFLKVYPLPIFVLLLSFVIYYSAFELLRKKENDSAMPQTEVDSMLTSNNQTAQVAANDIAYMEIDLCEVLASKEPQEAQNEPAQTPKTYLTSNAKSLNIRKEPNTTSAIVGKLTPADETILLEEKGEWIFIADATSEKPLGWIMKRFSKEIEIPEQNMESQELFAAPTTTQKPLVTASVRSLNIRQEPNTTSDVIGKLTPSHKATILEERGEWILIGTFEDNKVLGWILKRLSQEIPQEVTISTEPTTLTNTMPQLSVPEQSLTQNEAQIQKTEENKPLEVAQSTPEAPLYTSRVPSLNIRQLPSTDTPVIGKLTPNDSVIIVETQDVWVRILDANTPSVKNGWVVRRSLTLRP